MNSKKINKGRIMNLTFTIDNVQIKTHRKNQLLPSKPNFLKTSKISKMLDFISLHKKCNTNSNSFSEKNDFNTITKKKTKHIYVKKNNSISLNENVIHSNKENINLNNRNEFNTINNDKHNINNNLKHKNIMEKNSLLKKYNLEELEKIKEIIQKNNNTSRKETDRDIIQSKISELSSLKKLIFQNNNSNNFQFFKKLSRTNNILSINNKLNKRNTINCFHDFKKHKKTKTVDINNKCNRCITAREKLINYRKSKIMNITKKKSRNCKFNNSYYYFTENITNTDERNRTNYNLCSENNFKNNIFIDNNINEEIKLFKQRINKEKIFDKIRIMKKINHEKNSESQILTIKTKNYIRINKTPLIKKYLTKIKKLNIIKKVIKIDSCTVPEKSSQINTNRINQDNYLVKKEFLNNKNNFLLIISDGHGPYGHLISKYFCDILPIKINNISKETIQQSFLSVNNLLCTKSNIVCTLSGTSITSIIVTQDKIISANAGICKGILALSENGKYKIVNLTKQHNNKGIGILDLPYVQSYYFKGNEKFILLGTNGLWEFIENEECVKIIRIFYENGKDAKGALKTLVREAILRWKSEKNYVDDITAILLFFD